ncbi:MAG: c-type cytochrome [Opitutae bacterium]|nr:c-type cytochrome [Opitutae bacterium]
MVNPSLELTGDAGRGRKLFATHEIAACSRCHKIDGSGGDIGPALDGIASRKPSDYLRESIIDPQATMAEGYPVEVSPMPPYGVLLSQQEISDLLAYLHSLD